MSAGACNARLHGLVPERSGSVYGDWLTRRGAVFRAGGIEVATLDPFHGYKNAIDDHLADTVAVIDAFHVVKLATACVDDARRRVQHDTLAHRGQRATRCTGSA